MSEKIIGVLTSVLDGFYFGSILKSVTQKAKEYGIGVAVIGTSARYFDQLYAADYADGWIVIMDAVNNDYIQALRKQGKPVVGINTLLDVDYTITIDNKGMLDKAVEHLAGHGHTRIAYIGDTLFYDAKERYQGYVEALQKRGLAFDPDGYFDSMRMSIPEIAESMLKEGLPYSAVITVNDLLAVQLMHEFKTRRVRVPEDVAVIGIDDVPAAQAIRPALSTFRLPVNELGIQAVELLTEVLGHGRSAKEPVKLSVSPVFRNSCGCPSDTAEYNVVDPTETIQYLGNMMSRNFNLGVLMQTYKNNETQEMNWLLHTPFRRGAVGLIHPRIEAAYQVYRFNLEASREEERKQSMPPVPAPSFPPRALWDDPEFMGGDNAAIIVPIPLEEQVLGVMALVGLGDLSLELNPFNTTFQLANFFASALLREEVYSELQSYSEQLEIISNLTHDGIWEVDVRYGEVICKGGIFKLLGYSKETFPVTLDAVSLLLHPDDLAEARSRYLNHLNEHQPNFEVECRCRHANGSYVWLKINGHSQYDDAGNMVRVIGSVKDISERKHAENRIHELAYSDPLTGLANRNSFERQYAELLVAAEKQNNKLAVLLLDLDRFKLINDSYGNQSGDLVLRHAASTIKSTVKSGDLVARLGGDEFEIVMPNVRNKEEALETANRILSKLSEPFYENDREYYISCSIGIALYPEHGADTVTLSRNANLAMHQAKETGGNCRIYSPGAGVFRTHRLEMENQLRKALARDEMVVYYQPQYDLDRGSIYGAEALLRWNSPEFGLVSPDVFIPIAESTGLIIPIGEWVMREACMLSSNRSSQGQDPLKVSVNISARQLNHPDFVGTVRQVLAETGCRPDHLCLEITESMMLKDIDYSMKIVNELIRLGVSVSVDDFGTGYSSLSMLKRFPISELKIDKSFIKDMTLSGEDRAIVHAIIKLSQIMSLKVVAEGVETIEQLETLSELGADIIQGYYISKPLPVQELEAFLQSGGSRHGGEIR